MPPKKYRANIFRKIRWLLGGLLVAVFFGLLLFLLEKPSLDGLPEWVFPAFLAVVFTGGILSFLYGLFSILMNRVVVGNDTISVRILFQHYEIPVQDIIRVQTRSQRAVGSPMSYRKWYTIITDAKSYELDSYDIARLDNVLAPWIDSAHHRHEDVFTR